MQYLERDNGLFYVLVPSLVPGTPEEYCLVRPRPTSPPAGIHQQMTTAAELAVQVAALRDVRPLHDLGLELFHASEAEDMRWLRHTTLVQAVATFSLIDPFSDGPRGS
jgi:hypothetical protein